MASQMRLREQAQSSDATRLGKLLPLGFAAGMQANLPHHTGEQRFQGLQVAEGCFVATVGFHNPFNSRRVGDGHRL